MEPQLEPRRDIHAPDHHHPETTRVIVISPQGDHDGWTLAELIPHGFTGDELDRPRPATSRRPALPRRTKAL